MRVLFLAPAFSIHTVRWVNALTERGYKIYLATLPNHKNQENTIHSKVTVIELPVSGMKGYYLNAPLLQRLAEKIKPDVVNAHYASGYGTLMRRAKLKNTVLSVWGSDVYDFPYKNRLFMWIIQRNLEYADIIASTSYSMAKQTKKIMHKNLDITVTPFGVDLKQFSEKEHIGSDGILIGCVKTLEEMYGMEYLIKAVGILLEDLKKKNMVTMANNIYCHIYGDGSQRNMLQRLINDLGLSDVIKLKGKIPHEKVPSILSGVDIFCVLSVKDDESFGVAAVEAAAMGIPIVASDVSGFKEVIDDGVTGIIVERKSDKKAAKALERLVLDNKLRNAMGYAGRERVERLYDWEKNVGIMENIYCSILKGSERLK